VHIKIYTYLYPYLCLYCGTRHRDVSQTDSGLTHIHTAVGMLSLRVARYLPSPLHAMSPTPNLGLTLPFGCFIVGTVAGSAITTYRAVT